MCECEVSVHIRVEWCTIMSYDVMVFTLRVITRVMHVSISAHVVKMTVEVE